MTDETNKPPTSTPPTSTGNEPSPVVQEKKTQDQSNLQSEQQPMAVRENMVSTAVKFLQNPKVRQSPFPQRKAFLLKKGLTAKELQIAIERSGTASDEHRVLPNPGNEQVTNSPSQPVAVAPLPQAQVQTQIVPTQSIFTRHYSWRDIAIIAALISGALYGIKVLISRFVLPWFKQQKDNKEHLRRIETSVGELRADVAITVGGLQSTLETVKSNVCDLQIKLDSISRNSVNQADNIESHVVSELKKDLATIKGLMLSRQQFPAAPKLSQRNSSIPSWQKGSVEVGNIINGSVENGIGDKKNGGKFATVANGVDSDESTGHSDDVASELLDTQSNHTEINGAASE